MDNKNSELKMACEKLKVLIAMESVKTPQSIINSKWRAMAKHSTNQKYIR